jgi:lipoprotein-anchoring transpeptidase ErfK/SrfK
MSDDLERLLGDAFEAEARASVPETIPPPAPRFATAPHRHRTRWVAPLAAAAAVLIAVGGTLFAVRDRGPAHPPAVATAKPVRIKVATTDGTYGVGMPVVAYFSRQFRTAQPLAAATTVTVDGKPVQAAWYFVHSSEPGYPVEGHLRMRAYWPAHADVHVAIARNEVTASSSIDFHTGAQTTVLVLDTKHRMFVTRDGKSLGSYPVSLGLNTTPTMRGIKVIMTKQREARLRGPDYDEVVGYCQQLTSGGEYLLAAPWGKVSIQGGWDTSHGSTDLLPHDARYLYDVLKVGDVVRYPDADGPKMSMTSGIGDWNVPWRTWLTGGLIPTS